MKRSHKIALQALAACVALWILGGAALGWWFLTPARRTLRMPAALGLTRSTFRSRDGTSLGMWSRSVEGQRAVAVLAHGFRSDPHHWEPLVGPLVEAGIRPMALEFRAHGSSEGSRITFGATEREDVIAALDLARREQVPVLFVGFSMGAASYLLSGFEAHAAVLDSPYDDLSHALHARWATTHLPFVFALPSYAVVRSRLPVPVASLAPVKRVPRLRRPTHFVFAEHDHWVPLDAQERYRRALCTRCTFARIAGRSHGDHNDARWARAVTDFLAASLAPDAPRGECCTVPGR